MITVAELDYIQSGVQSVFFAATIFVVVYVALNRRWWKNIWAQMLVTVDMCLWLVDLPNCLRLWFHFNLNNSVFAVYDGTSLWITALVIVWRAGMIAWIQLTRIRRARLEGRESYEIRQGPMERSSTKHGAGWDDGPQAVRDAHPGGNGGGD